MNADTLATEIFTELGSPSTTTSAAISYWLKANLGALNSLINSAYIVAGDGKIYYEDSSTDPVTEVIMTADEAAILKKMYYVYDYDNKLRNILGASSWDSVVEVSDAGTRVRKVNKSEVGKTLHQAKIEEQKQLNDLVAAYKLKNSNPIQVAGDDTVEGNWPAYAHYDRTLNKY
tara:strand:+ start:1270 stop:1791 length:522 start_codon:yes stop_codon:yes gene_type:complete